MPRLCILLTWLGRGELTLFTSVSWITAHGIRYCHSQIPTNVMFLIKKTSRSLLGGALLNS